MTKMSDTVTDNVYSCTATDITQNVQHYKRHDDTQYRQQNTVGDFIFWLSPWLSHFGLSPDWRLAQQNCY